jgi:predicted TIM-barrel fold metal-dependent hydrolase
MAKETRQTTASPIVTRPEIVDAQIHCWQQRIPSHWFEAPAELERERGFLVDAVVEAMEAVGVNAAVLDSVAFSADGRPIGDSYGQQASTRLPSRLASLIRIDYLAGDVEERVREARALPRVLAIRSPMRVEEHSAGRYDRLLLAAERQGLPMFVNVWGHLEIADRIARAHPELLLIVDHLGMPQPPHADDPPFRRLPELLSLARYPNVAVKFSGAPSYSSEEYPFADVWVELLRVVGAFGPERLMWASDFTRFWGKYTYAELVDFILYASELSDREKAMILGETVRRLLHWPRPDGSSQAV